MNKVLSMVLPVVFVLLVAAFAWGVDYLAERWKRKRREIAERRAVGKCLPCPVCWKKDRLHMASWTNRKGRRFWFVQCERCGRSSIEDRKTPALAVRTWNETI